MLVLVSFDNLIAELQPTATRKKVQRFRLCAGQSTVLEDADESLPKIRSVYLRTGKKLDVYIRL